MVDNQLFDLAKLKSETYRKLGITWMFTGENEEYIADEYIVYSNAQKEQFNAASEAIHTAMYRTVRSVLDNSLWSKLHIPDFCIPLLQHSIVNEWDDHLVSRFDFSGGLEDYPIKLIEFNADTCSLMPETVQVQEELFHQEKIEGQLYQPLQASLVERWKDILERNSSFDGTLLLSSSGHREDWLNVEVLGTAALAAGFSDVQYLKMDKVIFSEEEGFFNDLGNDQYQQFHFWFKQLPWDLFAHEEKELWSILEKIILGEKGKVINPAYTMILQNKAFLQLLFDDNPGLSHLLKTSLSPLPFSDSAHYKKPIFGRMGENISVFDQNRKETYSTEGDYGDAQFIYQESAKLNMDEYGHCYQPSVYWTGAPAGICFRRQDDPVIDDDAEFVPSYLSK